MLPLQRDMCKRVQGWSPPHTYTTYGCMFARSVVVAVVQDGWFWIDDLEGRHCQRLLSSTCKTALPCIRKKRSKKGVPSSPLHPLPGIRNQELQLSVREVRTRFRPCLYKSTPLRRRFVGRGVEHPGVIVDYYIVVGWLEPVVPVHTSTWIDCLMSLGPSIRSVCPSVHLRF